MLSACWGSETKLRKKKGTASYSGGTVMVAGTACSRLPRRLCHALPLKLKGVSEKGEMSRCSKLRSGMGRGVPCGEDWKLGVFGVLS